MSPAARKPRILIIEDDTSLLEAYTVLLEDDYQVHTTTTGEAGLAWLARQDVHLLLLDLRLPGIPGLEVLRRVKTVDPRVPVIIITAMNEARLAVEALRLGAVDYLVKPFEAAPTLALVRRTLASPAPQEAAVRPAAPAGGSTPGLLVDGSPPMQALATLVQRVAGTDTTVLIQGETGVGKELVARTLHAQSPRQRRPFVVVNCAALVETLVASTLFGHERGAFTGAVARHQGAFERAHTGTLFLDEVGNLPRAAQGALLRVLQDRTVARVGSERPFPVDVRLVAATNQDVPRLVDAGTFRADLWYRLHVVPLWVPPLRERPEDIPLLVDHFLRHYNQAYGRQVPGVTPAALTVLTRYPWPGNVRELEHVLARLVALGGQAVLDVPDLPPEVRDGAQGAPGEAATAGRPATAR
jgi:DNA-binding NtrC family response regulator